jgi:hypothetical protein
MVLLVLQLVCLQLFGQPRPTTTVFIWQPWEQTFTSRVRYAKPYQEVSLSVTFSNSTGASFSSPGFWDADQTFKIRAAFPEAGVWTWKTTCSDPKNRGLHGQTGQVTVTAYTGDNPLFRHGFLQVGDSKRILTHRDGTPFLWMGDTGWLARKNTNLAEWQDYVDNRTAKHFNVIQTHASQHTPIEPNQIGLLPIENDLPNPEYFKDLESKITYANQKGIVILLVGLGYSGKGTYFPQMNTPEFARYLTARLAAYAVILSPSMDAAYDERNDQMGQHLKTASTVHLLTQHVGTVAGAAEAYHTKPYLDFDGLQSGHHNGDMLQAYDAAVNWTLNLWRMQPIKPIINTEAVYDGRGNNEGNNWREQDARKLGWIGWLSGALGYTYGAGETDRHVTGGNGGLFRFNIDSTQHDYWRNVIHWKSSDQMTYLQQFFAKLEWWTLEPAHDRILNQTTSPIQRMTFAKSPDNQLAVAYLPENHDIQLDLTVFPDNLTAQWFNPRENQYIPIKTGVQNKIGQTFFCPGAGDWVLLLQQK